MGYWEIAAGVMLIVSCVVLIGIILSQDAKGQGLSSVIMGGSGMMSDETRAQSKEARQVRWTKIFAVIVFALTILVNAISVIVG